MKVVCPHCLEINNIPYKESYNKANCGKCKKSLLDNKSIELNSLNFDEIVVNSDIPVIVDFWAPWCGPCKMMAPTFESVAKDYPLKVLFIKVNTENEQTIGARFGIRSIPTLMIFKNSKVVDQVSGALDNSRLSSFIDKNL
jgi:thioredoxin 2